MKRTTIMLPDDLAELVDRERRRRDVSAAAVIREAVRSYLKPPAGPKKYSFIGIARSAGGEPTAANIEDWLAREAMSDEAYNRMKYGGPSSDQAADNSEGVKAEPPGDLSQESGADHGASATG